MNATQKRQLISELAEAFWPATVVSRLWDIDDRSFLFVDFVRSFLDEDTEGDAASEIRRHIKDKIRSKLGESAAEEFVLSYSFEEGLRLDLFGSSRDATVSDELMNLVLGEVPESHIRETFKQFYLNFFERMESSPEEWHMRPIPTIE